MGDKTIEFISLWLTSPESTYISTCFQNYFQEICDDSYEVIINRPFPMTNTGHKHKATFVSLVRNISSIPASIQIDCLPAVTELLHKLAHLLGNMLQWLEVSLSFRQTTGIFHNGQKLSCLRLLVWVTKCARLMVIQVSLFLQPKEEQNLGRKSKQ